MSPQPAMAVRRRIYLATSLSPQDAQREFGAVLSVYDLVTRLEGAEFVIFDLDHPPRNWWEYIPKRGRRGPGILIPPEAEIPFLVRASGSLPPAAATVRDAIQASVPVSRFSASVQDLVNDLAWLECMIPYRRMSEAEADAFNRAASAINEAIRRETLTLMRIGGMAA